MRAKGVSGKRSIHMAAACCILGAAMCWMAAVPVQAAEPGTYLVTIKPTYSDPDSGKIEDPGNNEAIGQGMTEKLCGPTGLLEVDDSGNAYLTVRYYLSQFIKEVTFEERSGGSYSILSFQDTQTKAPVEGATDIDEKYGYTDYRMAVNSMDSVFRGKAYIEPMGRSVVYFFTVSNPVAGSGDFVTSLETQTAEPAASAETEAVRENSTAETSGLEEESQTGQEDSGNEKEQTGSSGSTDINGGGAADDPVTGIPQKPGSTAAATEAATVPEQSVKRGSSEEEYHLQSSYDLSEVPLNQARKLTTPMLESAVGITGMTGAISSEPSKASFMDTSANGNKTIMMALLAASAVLMARFAIATLQQERLKRQSAGVCTEERELQMPEYLEAARQLEQDYLEAAKRLRQEYLHRTASDENGEPGMDRQPGIECDMNPKTRPEDGVNGHED